MLAYSYNESDTDKERCSKRKQSSFGGISIEDDQKGCSKNTNTVKRKTVTGGA